MERWHGRAPWAMLELRPTPIKASDVAPATATPIGATSILEACPREFCERSQRRLRGFSPSRCSALTVPSDPTCHDPKASCRAGLFQATSAPGSGPIPATFFALQRSSPAAGLQRPLGAVPSISVIAGPASAREVCRVCGKSPAGIGQLVSGALARSANGRPTPTDSTAPVGPVRCGRPTGQ
jgi:hypothetical protein